MQTAERSPLAKAIKARPRKTYEFDVQGYMALGHEVHRIAIRVPTKREQDSALAGVNAYIARFAEKGSPLASDPNVLQDAMSAFILAACCLDPSTPEMMPVWPTGDVVSEDLTVDQIAVLVRLLNEVRAKESPVPIEIDDERVEAFIAMSALTAGTDAPDEVVASLTHPYLTQLYILTALKVVAARASNDEEPKAEDVPSSA